MSLTNPPLILFPLYPGGPKLRADSGGLNAYSSFRTLANRFTPSYGVNVPSSLNPNAADSYLTLNGRRVISSSSAVPVNELYNQPLGFDGRVKGGLTTVSVPAVAPEIPNIYKNAESLLSISELNLTSLLAQPDFRISGIGLGLKVTTDGAGGVANVAISPSSQGVIRRADASNIGFGGINRADVTIGATFKVTDLSINTGLGNLQPTNTASKPATSPTEAVNSLPTLAQTQLSATTLSKSAGIFNLQSLDELALQALQDKTLNLDKITPDLERLYALQANQGTGTQSALAFGADRLQSQQQAATQAGLGVNPSDTFQTNVIGLINASRQSESYAATYAPRMDQVMNGRIAGSPWIQGQTSGNLGGALGNATSFEMGAAVADAMSRRGRSAGYLPFGMQTSGQGSGGFSQQNPFLGTGTGTSGGFSNLMGGQSDQQFRQPRKPLAFIA